MSIYRAYDIRGVYGKDLTCDIAESIGRSYGTYVGGGDIVVGMDCRLSSESLHDALIRGLTSAGCDVTDIGMVPTPLLYFSIHHYGKAGGIMITGSHNGPEYNGFKLCRGTDTLYGEKIQDLKKIIETGDYRTGSGSVSKKEVIDDYIAYVKERVQIERKIKVVVDAGNGVGGLVAPRLLRELGCEVLELYCAPDGKFPNHGADPTVDANLSCLKDQVKCKAADLGIAFDGDADRLGVVDDTGGVIRGDQSLILFAREVLKDKAGGKIIFEVKCSQAVIEEVEKAGGIPIMYRTGHSFIKKKMKEEDSPLAGEMSGHFFFADRYYGYDDGIYAGARMVELLSKSEGKLSGIVSSLPTYFSTPEIRIHCPEEEKFRIVESVTADFKNRYEVVTVDGARIQFGDGWGLIRASNTEPALILRFEAKSSERLEEIKETVKADLLKYPCIKESLEAI